jgi:hypothetical protein
MATVDDRHETITIGFGPPMNEAMRKAMARLNPTATATRNTFYGCIFDVRRI